MRKKNKKKSIPFIILTLLICILIAGLTSASFFSTFNVNKSKNSKINKNKSSINVLILGLDIGDATLTGDNIPKRSDTMMVANYNADSNKCSLLSIPRDTYIEINKKKNKINAAYAIGGIDLAKKSVEELLDTSIDYYVTIDYAGFNSFIDAIGGIDMDIDRDMIYDDNTQNLHINFKKGENVHLDGKKAEEFFRWRKNNDGSGFIDGDLGRIENQHKLMNKVVDKVTSPKIITKIGNIIKVIPEYVKMDLGSDELLKYGMGFVKIDKDDFNQYTLKGDTKYINGISYFLYDKRRNEEALALLNGESERVDKIKSEKEVKDTLNVEVLNGTKTSGLAKDMGKILRDKGYAHVTVGNGKAGEESKIIVKREDKYVEEILKRDLNINNVEYVPDEGGNFDIIITLGKDFKKE